MANKLKVFNSLVIASLFFFSSSNSSDLKILDQDFSANIVDTEYSSLFWVKNDTTLRTPKTFKKDNKKFWEKVSRSFFKRNKQYFDSEEIEDLTNHVMELAFRYKIHPGLIISVINVESKFNPFAVSPKGAIGLMQIMPETGEWISQMNGMPWIGSQSLFDRKLNLAYGVYYLSYLKTRFNGDWKKVLCAYNQGPAKIDLDLSRGKSTGGLEYYKKVRAHMNRLSVSSL